MSTAADSIDVSIILICWNSVQLTSDALQSIIRHTAGVSYELIVIDNGSTMDGGAAELTRRFPRVRMIANPGNRGFAAANNQGIDIAVGRCVLLLNSDTLQIENAIGKAVDYLDRNPAIGVLGVGHKNGDSERTYQPSAARFPTPLGAIAGILPRLNRVQASRRAPTPTLGGGVDWVTGSFFLIRRSCLERVGRLDERFFVYSEDIDWCFRARMGGWIVRYWPDVSIVHFGSSSASQIADKTFMIHRNQMEFFRKHCSAPMAIAYYIAMSARLAVSTLLQVAKWLIGRATRQDVRGRWLRQFHFMTLKSDRCGLSKA